LRGSLLVNQTISLFAIDHMNPHQHERKKRKLKKNKEDMIKLHNYEFPTERKARIESILFTDN